MKTGVNDIRKAISDFNPDVIYSEFSLPAIIAGKLENKKIYVTSSYPTQYEYSCTPKYAGGLNKLLRESKLPAVESALQIFLYADKTFVPSCRQLEPFQRKDIIFCGALQHINPVISKNRDKILVYMGNGTISQGKMIKEIMAAFKGSPCSVYLAGRGLKEQSLGNIHIASHFNFQKLLPECLLFIHHGGQNSMTDALIYGVPQLICAGKVFERKYNASSIVRSGAGLEIPCQDFTGRNIKAAFEKIISDESYQTNAAKIGQILLSLGGTKKIIQTLIQDI